jgi:hypothetical protein
MFMKRVLVILLILLMMLLPGCLPPNRSDFSKRKYLNHRGMHRKIPIYYQSKYRNPSVKPQTRREMLKPKVINLDKW